jgi:hypothetical protein
MHPNIYTPEKYRTINILSKHRLDEELREITHAFLMVLGVFLFILALSNY